VRGQRHAPAVTYPGKDPVPIVQGAGSASGLVWTCAENLPPPGFDPRTVQPVGSRYTDYATQYTVGLRVWDLTRVSLLRNWRQNTGMYHDERDELTK